MEEPEHPALYLFTSGTTAEPKAAVLEHHHLAAYVFGSVEFAGAGEEEAALVSVPPYHIAGVANLLSNVFAGRRIIYLPSFDPAGWLATVRAEGITQAMVVPTMLARIVEELGRRELGRGPDAAGHELRGGPHAGHRPRARATPLSRHRIRQRLRTHGDQLVDRRPRTR